MFALALIFGVAVGFSLGLTGGGGSILAVPLLVYGLSVAPREAVGVSLAAVGGTALAGAVQRLWRHEVEVGTGLLFAALGVLGAPLGSWAGRKLPDTLLLLGFAGLMLWVAVMMWLKATRRPAEAAVVRAAVGMPVARGNGPTCRRDPEGRLRLTSRCAMLMSAVGLATGVLSGMFGVGGGFVIVPALTLFTRMSIQRAVATSLLVITLVSASGVASYVLQHGHLRPGLTGLFLLGGVAGLYTGTFVGRRLSPVALQKVFAVVIVAVAAFVIVRNVG